LRRAAGNSNSFDWISRQQKARFGGLFVALFVLAHPAGLRLTQLLNLLH
jgi:hypothetical protein